MTQPQGPAPVVAQYSGWRGYSPTKKRLIVGGAAVVSAAAVWAVMAAKTAYQEYKVWDGFTWKPTMDTLTGKVGEAATQVPFAKIEPKAAEKAWSELANKASATGYSAEMLTTAFTDSEGKNVVLQAVVPARQRAGANGASAIGDTDARMGAKGSAVPAALPAQTLVFCFNADGKTLAFAGRTGYAVASEHQSFNRLGDNVTCESALARHGVKTSAGHSWGHTIFGFR